MRKAIVTGKNGQDGRLLIQLLQSKGYEVVAIGREDCDITEYNDVLSLLQAHSDVHEIYNLAARSHVGFSFKDPITTWNTNVNGCFNFLRAIKELKIPARFVQAGSSEMYGKETGVKNEQSPRHPCNPYGQSKSVNFEHVSFYRKHYSVHASTAILYNHESPLRSSRFVTRKITSWVAKFNRWLDTTEFGSGGLLIPDDEVTHFGNPSKPFKKLRLGNLEAFRDWGCAGDYVEAMWMMTQKEEPDDYVICTGETHTIREFLDAAFSCIGIEDWTPFVVQDPEFFRPVEHNTGLGDNTKARTKLGWEPKTKFEDMVKGMVDADLQNQI